MATATAAAKANRDKGTKNGEATAVAGTGRKRAAAKAEPTTLAPATAPRRGKKDAAAVEPKTLVGGYTTEPTITFGGSGGGSGAKATAVGKGTNGGSGYTSAKVVEPRPAPPATLPARTAKRLADELKLVAEASRLRVVWMLEAKGEAHVGAMCEAFGSRQPALSHSLSILRHAGVVECRRSGKNNVYDLTRKGKSLARLVLELDSAE